MNRSTLAGLFTADHDTPRHGGTEHHRDSTSVPRCLRVSWAVAVVAVVLTFGSHVALAHHAFSAEFDSSKPVELKGVVTKIQWTNPHSWIFVDVKEPNGQVTSWAIEFGSPYSLLQKGLRKTSFPIGVEVVVKGHRAKSGKTVANASSVTMPDGKGFYTGAEDSPDAQASAARD